MKNGVAHKNQNLNKHPLCNLGQYWSYIETSALILEQIDGMVSIQ